MIITKMHISRRTVLRGLGAALALPLLDSMVPALTAARRRPRAAPVKRLGVFYVPNGMSMPYWFPKAEGPLSELPPTLKSLAGVQGPRAAVRRPRRRAGEPVKGGGDHARSAGTFLTGVPFKLTSAPTSSARCRWIRSSRRSCRSRPSSARSSSASSRTRCSAPATAAQLRLHNTIAWRNADHAAADRERSARGVRAAVRHQRQHRSGRAARAHRSAITASSTSSASSCASLQQRYRPAGQGQVRRVPRRRSATSSAASRWPRSRTPASCRSSISRPAFRPTTRSTPG